jgi:hypothetical protein
MFLQTTNASLQYKASFRPACAASGIFEFNATLMESNLDDGTEGKLHLPRQHHTRQHILLLTMKEVQGKSN